MNRLKLVKLFLMSIAMVMFTACGGSGAVGESGNVLPIANAGADQIINEGDSVTLLGALSNDPDGSIVGYEWKEGATVLGATKNVTLDALSVGTHTITLTVTDNDGATGSASVTVTVNAIIIPAGAIKKTGQTKSYAVNGAEVTDGSLKDDGYYQKGITSSYTRDDIKQTVTDHITGLQWQDDDNAKTVQKNWADAQTHCSTLSLDGGGWRLPTSTELESIVDYGKAGPAVDTVYFNHIISGFYWLSTTYQSDGNGAWLVDFSNGLVSYKAKDSNLYVRCVRDGQ